MPTKIKLFVNTISIALLIVSSAFVFRSCRLNYGGLNDDAYISLCYAKNLAAGNGFVFNHGIPTLGTTTPLFTLSVAGIGRLLSTSDIARVAICLTTSLWAGLPWILFYFRRIFDLQVWEAVIVGLFILTFRLPNIGAESIPFQFILLATVACFARNKYYFAGFLLGLLTLCRGEGMLLAPVFCLLLFLRDIRKRKWRTTQKGWSAFDSLRKSKSAFSRSHPMIQLAIGMAVPLLLWAIYAQMTFGYIVPQTLWIKMQQGRSFSFEDQFFSQFLNNIQQWTILRYKPDLPGIIVVQWIMVGLGLVNIIMKRRGFVPYILWCICYIGAYTAFGVPGWFWWYRLPVHWCLTFLSAIGLIGCISFACRSLNERIQCGNMIVGGSATVAVFIIAIFNTWDIPEYVQNPQEEIYRKVANWMNANTDPQQSLASAEVGYIGYFTSNRIIDKSGLIMPRGFDYEGNRKWNIFLFNYRPDYFVRGAKCPRGCPERLIVRDLVYSRERIFTPRTPGEDYALYRKKGMFRSDTKEIRERRSPGKS